MNRTAVTHVSCLVLLFAAGCHHAPRTFEMGPLRLGFDFDVNQFLSDPPKTELNITALGMDALAAVNHDHFFPPDTSRALLSQDAVDAGLFRPREPQPSTLYGISPDSFWLTEVTLTSARQHGVMTLTRRSDEERHNFWSTGNFESLYWSPDSRRFALNEIRANGRRNAFFIDVIELDQQRVDARTNELSPFITPAQFERSSQNEIRGWLNHAQFLHWVFGKPDENGLPRWGVEFVIDATIPAPAFNARVLRAYVRD